MFLNIVFTFVKVAELYTLNNLQKGGNDRY